MSPTAIPGSCFCGAVRFVIEPPAGICCHCHCPMCRRLHGAAYVTWVEMPRAQVEITAGADRLRTFDSSSHGRRSFCTQCGSALFCELDARAGYIDVVVANLEGDFELPPQLHIFYDHRASWTVVADDLPRLGGDSGMEPIERKSP